MSTAQPTYDDILRLFQETDRQLKETALLLREKSLETDRKFQETEHLLRERSLETDRKFQETNLQLKELGKQIGGLGSKFGSFTEGLALPSMEAILQQRFGMTVVLPRVRAKQQGEHLEIDVLAYANGEVNRAFLVEVKSHPREEAITQLKITLRLKSVRGIGWVPLATLTQLPQPLLGSLAQINGETPRSQVQVLLREGHLNMVLSKGGFDGEVEIAFDDQLTVGLGNPDQELKVKGIVAKPQKKHLGRGAG